MDAKVYDQEGNRTTLLNALSGNGFVKNQSVGLEVSFGKIFIVSTLR